MATDARWAPIVMPLAGDDARLHWEEGVAEPPQARTELPWHQDDGYAPTNPRAVRHVLGITEQLLDDRLVVARRGEWLDEPIRERPIDMKQIISNYAKD